MNPDFIDINCGCCVKKHVSKGECAALLKDLPKMEKVIKAVVKSKKLPVTVKTRLGWDAKSIVIEEAAKMVEQSGARALAVHCRTRSQAYKDHADWTWLEKIRKVISIPLIGNGDVKTPHDVKMLFDMGCDGVMIGRGAVNNPWIFKEAKHYLRSGSQLPPPTLEDRIALCVEHLNMSAELKGEKETAFSFRKFYIGYLKGIRGVSKLRMELMNIDSKDKIIERLQYFLKEHTA